MFRHGQFRLILYHIFLSVINCNMIISDNISYVSTDTQIKYYLSFFFNQNRVSKHATSFSALTLIYSVEELDSPANHKPSAKNNLHV